MKNQEAADSDFFCKSDLYFKNPLAFSRVSMKRLACSLVALTLLACAIFTVGDVHAQIANVALTSNTEWTAAESPINFNGSVTVSSGVTLTIDPGVTVNIGYYGLYVYGTLTAQGNAGNQIIFNGPNDQQASATAIVFWPQTTPSASASSQSIIQFATLNGVGVSIESGMAVEIDSCSINYASAYGGTPISVGSESSATISNNVIDVNLQGDQYSASVISESGSNASIINNQFEGSFSYTNTAVSVNGGSPVISGNTFDATYCNNSCGVNVNSGTPQINSNQFDGDGWLVGVDDSSSSAFSVSNNVFSNCFMGVDAQGGTLTVQGNQFLKGTDGIDIDPPASVTVTDNLIDSNSRYGINGGGTISYNTISNNQIGIHNPPSGVISENNIVGNTVNSITSTVENVDALYNWWGSTSTALINQTIYDTKVDPHLGTVLFVPFLTSPSTSAPTIPSYTPALTPAPTPLSTTLPSVVVPPNPTPTPQQYSQTFDYQVGSLLNLNLIATATALVLVLAWVIVILGYAAKNAISKRRTGS